MNANAITVSAQIAADKSKVWDYYTSPKHIKNWNFADPSWHCPEAKNDLKVGGTYFARMEARDGSFGFDFEAEYTKINMGTGFTYEFGGRECAVVLQESDDLTQITVTFEPEDQNPIDLQQQGWQAILNNFKQYTESN
ncbi:MULTISPECIES: SRPBCC domain-containing protein [unclassified Leeuwenhoekiella]|uniref:SRPBCC domain-containing protein n=1 Tax=unclassified Leeuwenhoekiella TaxID=2615029 RepID=UPI000C498817|nr:MULTISPECIES: SRPBCC domain-containing protein [unclassified Leeuwenhoekiella]MAW96557.1 activator of HSP90 ATPase [Leeuwenhoekiella sp.]MBA81445.1 activator of HSP90 ATPase [Leeuwenhoekiella sp.]|tara:strand:+ start:13588 stop:14001 length:414 start_codon:yes stop_codon:yes gene_type:complete